MRRNWTKCVYVFSLLAILFLTPACQNDIHERNLSKCEVAIYAGGTQTRTQMQPNGLSTVWETGDLLALWARNQAGTFTLSNQTFKAYGLDSGRGFFTSTLDSEMPQGTYTYYCCYPKPKSVDGTKVTFDVPAVQDGKASSGADIMVADPTQFGPLTVIPQLDDDHSLLSLNMNRMMHQFRFYVPAENTVLGNEQITKIVVTFPRNVVGTTTLDLADPSSAAVLSSGTKQITLNLKSPLKLSSGNEPYFACMAINPTKFAEGETMQIKAYTSNRIAQIDPVDLCARDFQAGHSTPVKLKVKSIIDYPYLLTFTLGANNLGEKPNSITLTAPQSCKWEGAGSNVYTYSPGRKIEVGEKIVIRFEDEAAFREFSNKSISVVYDSDNVLSYQTIVIPDITSANSASASLSIPYLLIQDFSGIGSFNDGHDNPTVGMSSDTWKGINELSGNGLAGWYATRIGVQGGTAARICCRFENVTVGVGSSAYYKGRLYTPILSNIKDGKDVKLSVSFRYGSNRSERDPLFGSPPKKSVLLYFGVNTESTVTNPDSIEGDLIDSVTGLIAGSGFASSAPSSLNPMPVKGVSLKSTGGSYTSFEGTMNVTVDNVDNGMRLGWIVSTDNTSTNTNGNYWLYIDDIKVQIAQ